MKTHQQAYQKIYYLLFFGLCFFMPVYDKIVAVIIILIALNWLFDGQFAEKYQRIRKDRHRQILISFSLIFIAYSLGLGWSDNFLEGLGRMETKLSLLVFPVVFSSIDKNIFSKKQIGNMFWAFTAGCMLVSVWLISNSIIDFMSTRNANVFFYINLADYHHTSYLSMYINLAVVFIITYTFENWKVLKYAHRAILILLSVYFYLFIIMLSSKAGIASLFITLLILITYLTYQKRKFIPSMLSIFALVLIFILSLASLQRPLKRFLTARQTIINFDGLSIENTESTAERMLIWKSALEISKENILFGFGTGDTQKHLASSYKEQNIEQAYKLGLNAHNQYLQTLLSVGVFGLIALFWSLFTPAFFSLKRKMIPWFIFLMIVGFHFLFESMLCRQSGVVFFSFFNALFFYAGIISQDTALEPQ